MSVRCYVIAVTHGQIKAAFDLQNLEHRAKACNVGTPLSITVAYDVSVSMPVARDACVDVVFSSMTVACDACDDVTIPSMTVTCDKRANGQSE